MRILFVYPEYHHKGSKPIGISILSRLLKQQNHQVDIFDTSVCDLSPLGDYFIPEPEKIILFKPIKKPKAFPFPTPVPLIETFKNKVEEFKPDVIAVSASNFQFTLAKAFFNLPEIKALLDDIPVLVGGINATLTPDEVIAEDFTALVCIGEGEDAMLDLVTSMDTDKSIKHIENVWFKDGSNVIKNPPRALIENLDDIPFVDWSIYPDYCFEKPYEGEWWRGGDLMSARGCFNQCTYCFYSGYTKIYGMTKNKIRFMSPERFVEELKYVYSDYGVIWIKVRDSNFFARRTSEIARMAEMYDKDKDNLPFLVLNGYPDTITEEKVKLVKRMKCLSVGIGLETGNAGLRVKYLGRYTKNEKFLQAVDIIKKHGIRIASFNMLGLPGETREMVHETIALNKKARPDIADMSIMFPFSGTEIHRICKDMGILADDFENIPYFRNEAVLDMPDLTIEEMNGLAKTFQLYLWFPRIFYPIIRRAEKEDELGMFLYDLLLKLFYLSHHGLDIAGKMRWLRNAKLSIYRSIFNSP